MNISKTTINMAAKRGIEIVVEEGLGRNGETLVCFWDANDENTGEWMFSYAIANDGTLVWNGNIYLRQDVKEELPATIFDERQLRNVIKFVAGSMPQVF